MSTPLLFRLAAQAATAARRARHAAAGGRRPDGRAALDAGLRPALGDAAVPLRDREAVRREAGRVPSAAEGGLRVRADGAAAGRGARGAGRSTARARRDRGVHEAPEAAAERARGGDCRRCACARSGSIPSCGRRISRSPTTSRSRTRPAGERVRRRSPGTCAALQRADRGS